MKKYPSFFHGLVCLFLGIQFIRLVSGNPLLPLEVPFIAILALFYCGDAIQHILPTCREAKRQHRDIKVGRWRYGKEPRAINAHIYLFWHATFYAAITLAVIAVTTRWAMDSSNQTMIPWMLGLSPVFILLGFVWPRPHQRPQLL